MAEKSPDSHYVKKALNATSTACGRPLHEQLFRDEKGGLQADLRITIPCAMRAKAARNRGSATPSTLLESSEPAGGRTSLRGTGFGIGSACVCRILIVVTAR
jgi:hypothetical protein